MVTKKQGRKSKPKWAEETDRRGWWLWSPLEIKYIRDHADTVPVKDMAVVLGRAVVSIYAQAYQHKISLTSGRWSNQDLDYLRNSADSIPVGDMAVALGRTVTAIRTKAHECGISLSGCDWRAKARPWTAEDDAILKKNAGSMSIEELAAKLGRTVGCTKGRAHRINLLLREVETFKTFTTKARHTFHVRLRETRIVGRVKKSKIFLIGTWNDDSGEVAILQTDLMAGHTKGPYRLQLPGKWYKFPCGCEGVLPEEYGTPSKFVVPTQRKGCKPGWTCRVSNILGASVANARRNHYESIDPSTPHAEIRRLMDIETCCLQVLTQCSEPLNWKVFAKGKTPPLHHDHQTGAIHGFVHPRCNLLVELVIDDHRLIEERQKNTIRELEAKVCGLQAEVTYLKQEPTQLKLAA